MTLQNLLELEDIEELKQIMKENNIEELSISKGE